MGDVDERLWGLLETWLEAEGIELDDLAVLGRGAGTVVRVTVDSPSGIGVDRIADLSRGISRLLDQQEALSGPYSLEVSSPGLERTLHRPAQYRKAVGSEVVVKTRAPVAGAQSHRGTLTAVNEDRVALAVDGADRTIPLTDVAQARTVFRWDKAPKPGKRGSR